MGIRETLIKRAWLILTITLSLITGVVIGNSLKSEPTFSNVFASLGLTLAWVFSMLWSVFKEARQNEKEQKQERIRQEEFLVNDLEKWMDKTVFAMLYYKNGEICFKSHKNPDSDSLYYYDEVVNILEKCEIYPLWIKGKEDSKYILNEGENAFKVFQKVVDKKLENITLKKLLSYNAIISESSYNLPRVIDTIFTKVNGDTRSLIIDPNRKNRIISSKLEPQLKGSLFYGTTKLAKGKIKILNHLKEIIYDLIENENIKKQIEIYNEAKRKLDSKLPFMEFKRRLDKLIKNWERFHEFRTQS